MKMVAVDTDGTILDPEGHISPRTFRAFEKVTASGGYVAIVSGRGIDPYPHALAAAEDGIEKVAEIIEKLW